MVVCSADHRMLRHNRAEIMINASMVVEHNAVMATAMAVFNGWIAKETT